jgi:hypothetical protein
MRVPASFTPAGARLESSHDAPLKETTRRTGHSRGLATDAQTRTPALKPVPGFVHLWLPRTNG